MLEVLVPGCGQARSGRGFLLTAKRDLAAARRFFERAIDGNGVPEKITIDKSGADTASVQSLVEGSGLSLSAADQFYSLAF